MIDESTDIKTEKKLLVYARFVNTKALEAETHFLSKIKIPESSVIAIVVTAHLNSKSEEFKVELKKVCGFESNGASLMTGCKSGVGIQMKGKDPLMVTIHCIAHRLVLASAQAAESDPYLKDVFQKTMTDLYYYFSKSLTRTSSLSAIQCVLDEPRLKIKEIIAECWFAFYEALQAIYRHWSSLVTYFVERKKESICIGFSKKVADFTSVSTLHFMMDVMPSLTELSQEIPLL